MPMTAPTSSNALWDDAERRVETYLRAMLVPAAIRQEMVSTIIERARAHSDEPPLAAAMREVQTHLSRQVTRTQGIIPSTPATGSAAWRVAVWRHSACSQCTWRAVPWGSLRLSHEGQQFSLSGMDAMPMVQRAVVAPAQIRPAPEGFLSRLLGLNEEQSN
ncbi:MAG: hypothetical protein B7Y40_09435 [Gammaproteobacteria bacterium 28-57-27]|nr:MAG: hypothetical protein B7Y40_09435 [Gammaproteobacteria bacterium 28-57-27]